MKIALCISGMSRSFKTTFPSIKQYILDPYQPDVFVSTWKPTFEDPMFPDTDSAEELVDLYQPKIFDIELYDKRREASFQENDFHLRSDQAGKAVKRMLPMFYKIYKANFHKRTYERYHDFTYDIVIRCRSDLLFSSKLEFQDVSENIVAFPEVNNQNGVNDQFWYSESKVGDDVAELYNAIPNFWRAGVFIHGETLLYSAIAVLDLTVRLVQVDYCIQR